MASNKRLFSPIRPLCAVVALVFLAAPHLDCLAGGLLDVYSSLMTTGLSVQVVDFQNKAAEQNVAAQKRGYMPRLAASAHEAWAYQDIRESGNPSFPRGKDDFARTRAQVEMDQPLFDPTVKPSVEAAKARLRQAQSRGALQIEVQTREIVEEYLRLARFKELIESVDRVIARLELEAASVAKSSDARIATFGDVQNIKLSLAAMRRERNNFAQYQNRSMAVLGVGPEAVRSACLSSNALTNFSAPTLSDAAAGSQKVELMILRAELDEYANQAAAENNRALPTLSLYAEYGHYKDGGSIFGGTLDHDDVEAGVVAKWDIFDRGIHRSKAQEYAYLVQAKEAELHRQKQLDERASKTTQEILEQSRRSVAELADLVEQNKLIMVSSARAYDAGKETYINTINAYLASESAVREWINARHDLVMAQIGASAQNGGWNKLLVERVDKLFSTSK